MEQEITVLLVDGFYAKQLGYDDQYYEGHAITIDTLVDNYFNEFLRYHCFKDSDYINDEDFDVKVYTVKLIKYNDNTYLVYDSTVFNEDKTKEFMDMAKQMFIERN